MSIPLYQVDAFTAAPFAGNPAAVCRLPAARDATLELSGPEARSPLEVVRIFERLRGRRFEVRLVGEDELRAQEAAATDPMQRSFAALMRCYARGDPTPMTATLAVSGLEPTSVEHFAAETVARLAAHV